MQHSRTKLVDRWGVGTAALVEEVVRIAERLRAVQVRQRKRHGAMPATARLLHVVATSNRYLAIADAARLMRMTRQSARELALRATGEGTLVLLPNPDDRRVLQLEITARGRGALAALEHEQRVWLDELLVGLSLRELDTTLAVLRELRDRLVRVEDRGRRVSRR
jgi:DNA-binding MarR family transcriptional regulator